MMSKIRKNLENMLRLVGLRPTRQRLLLAGELFGDGDLSGTKHHRHIQADELYDKMVEKGQGVSLATIYNCLNQFVEVGLLSRITLDSGASYFDTNTDTHYHLYDNKTQKLIDIPIDDLDLGGMVAIPKDREIAGVNVVITLK